MTYSEDQLRAMIFSIIATAKEDPRPGEQGVREATDVLVDLYASYIMALPEPAEVFA